MNSQEEVAHSLRIAQIVSLGFIGSVFMLIGAALVVAGEPGAANETFAVVLGLVGVLEIATGELLPGIITQANEPEHLKGWLARKYWKVLLGNIFRESAAIVGLVIFILNPADYLISVTLWGLSLLFLVGKFPTKQRFTEGIPPELLRD